MNTPLCIYPLPRRVEAGLISFLQPFNPSFNPPNPSGRFESLMKEKKLRPCPKQATEPSTHNPTVCIQHGMPMCSLPVTSDASCHTHKIAIACPLGLFLLVHGEHQHWSNLVPLAPGVHPPKEAR